jgi:Ribbon-helix-helix protein, copG family
MSQVITLELSDEVCAALKQKAESAGISLSELIKVTLDQQSGSSSYQKTDIENEAARQRFRRHAGVIDLGYSTGADNASIDADLVRAYSGDIG